MTPLKFKGELMNNGSIYKPKHIRKNLKYYSPGITEHNHLCLEYGYCSVTCEKKESEGEL